MTEKTQDERLVQVWKQRLAAEKVQLGIDGLGAALKDSRSHIRVGAAIILGRTGDISVVPELTELLRDGVAMVRVEAAMALVLLGDGAGIPALIEALGGDLITNAPTTAAGYLASLGDPRGYRVVARALRSDLAGVRLQAAVVLRNFLPYQSTAIDGQKVDLLAILEEALKDPEPIVRRELLHKLAVLDSAEAAALLSRFSETDADASVRRTASDLLSQQRAGCVSGPPVSSREGLCEKE